MTPALEVPQPLIPTCIAGRCGLCGGAFDPRALSRFKIRRAFPVRADVSFVLRGRLVLPSQPPQNGILAGWGGLGRHPVQKSANRGRTGPNICLKITPGWTELKTQPTLGFREGKYSAHGSYLSVLSKKFLSICAASALAAVFWGRRVLSS